MPPHGASSLPSAIREGGWRRGLPTLEASKVALREPRKADAAALLASMSTHEVARFISPPPNTIAGFERFIAWAHRQRAAGQYVCYAVVSRQSDVAIGLVQIRSLEPDFGTAEWGFALACEHWGTGAFAESAGLALGFAFDVLGTHRIEARAALRNGRGNNALRKLGAVHEGVLRRSFLRDGEYLDQALWTILADEWRQATAVGAASNVH